MPTEIDKIFTATARSTWHFLIENGQGCYIPAYQRPYAWDKENISRLFEDILHGIQQILHRSDIISFFGTIIAIHDTQYHTVQPLYRSEVAPRVMTIIDGQQRICTAIMSNIVLHDAIRRAVAKFKVKKGTPEPHLFWIIEACTQLLADLKDSYMMDRASGDENYRYYPRVIRAYDDVWSRRRVQARYDSPVAKLIWDYINFTEDGEGKKTPFKFEPTAKAGKEIDHYKMVDVAFSYIKDEVNRICREKDDRYDFPHLETATQSPSFSEGIWGFSLPKEVKQYVAEGNDNHYSEFCYLLRLIIFARYLNHHLAITVVTTRNEDDAFDMFEALNTTGEPLTAFETFKPKVIESEKLEKYEHSPSHQSITQIEEYLDRYSRADDKQRATSEMLLPFALAETGFKLQKKLNSQRRYLRKQFDSLDATKEKQAFVDSLAGVARFMKYGWDVEPGKDPSFAPLEIKDEEALVGFEALRGLKHSITIAPLSRFYQQALDAPQGEGLKQRTEEFVAAIKATVAFSFLWRSAKGGTENIDSHYRDIMRVGIKDENIPPLARRTPDEKSGLVSLPNYKKALRWLLKNKAGVETQDEWVQIVIKTDVYSHSNVLARFLLFCASDDAVPDKTQQGLIKRGRQELAPMLRPTEWKNDVYFTVEHIAPQSKSAGWDPAIFEDHGIVHTLGNLMLLPSEANKVLSKRSWEHKRLVYQLLASETQSEFESISEKLAEESLQLSPKATDVLAKAKYLGMCKSVVLFDKPWSVDIIQKRTRRFAELAWDRLKPWLF